MDCLCLGIKDSILEMAAKDDDLAPCASLRLVRLE